MAIKNLDSGMKVLRSYVNNTVPSKIKATTQEIAQYALQKSISFSPFVTGRFAASWRVSLAEDLGESAPAGKRLSLEESAQESLAASQEAITTLKFGSRFFIGNTSPYAEFVEFGSPTTEARYISRRVAQAVGGRFGRIVI